MRTTNFTQRTALVAVVGASANRAASSYGDATVIDASIYDRLAALLDVGVLAGAATVTLKWQHCSASASSDSAWADVQGTSCITSAYASTSNSKQEWLEIRLDQPNSANSAAPVQRYLRPLITVATSSWTGAAYVFGDPKYAPAKDVDASTVAAITVY